MADYADYTYNSSNLLRRFSHRTRFKYALSAILSVHTSPLHLLDYGCGDAMFINELRKKLGEHALLIGYEPYLDTFAQNAERIEQNWDQILMSAQKQGKFDVVTCFEVLEHLPDDLLQHALQNIHAVLEMSGLLIVSVPIETGLPALLKGVLRRREGELYRQIWSWKNIFRSVVNKPVTRIAAEEGYLHHMGFRFQELENQLAPFFVIENTFFSPLKGLGSHFNSQVFYILSKR